MKMNYLYVTFLAVLLTASSCSRKTHPATTSSETGDNTSTTTKPVVKKIRTAAPKVIVVNDSVAKKTFDGRYYYDLEGHRYWRNNKDGKYYIYNKSMNTNPDFKAP